MDVVCVVTHLRHAHKSHTLTHQTPHTHTHKHTHTHHTPHTRTHITHAHTSYTHLIHAHTSHTHTQHTRTHITHTHTHHTRTHITHAHTSHTHTHTHTHLICDKFKYLKGLTLPCVCTYLQYGRTPLHSAAYNGYIEVVRHLISSGADVNKANEVSVRLHWLW